MKTNRYNLDFLKYVDYDETSPSCLRWSWRKPEEFASRLQYEAFMANTYGQTAGSLNISNPNYPRWITKINNKQYLNSRIVYSIFNDDLDDSVMVDHKNTDSSDDRIDNLRKATRSQNGMNSNVQSGHSLGVKGVRFYQGKYRARITLNGILMHLGSFLTIEEAKFAYDEAAKGLHKEYARS